MIISQLSGGLGNQMFEYSFGRNIAISHNTELKYDFYNPSHVTTSRYYELNIFKLDLKQASRFDFFLLKVINWQNSFKNFKVQELGLNYDAQLLQAPNNSYIKGYFQSYHYFSDIERTLRNDFTFKNLLSKQNEKISELMKKTNSVAVHIRRGDYISDKTTNSIHGVCSSSYYKQSLEYISRKVKTPYFFIFSDDQTWVKNSLLLPKNSLFIDWNQKRESYLDMQLMTQCKHNIIANSTFSWWGAWLNSNPKKIIISPKKWYKKNITSPQEIIPNSWIRL